MFTVGKLNIEKAVLLAPMEDVTDISFRLVCRELGADIVYTEFVNSEGLIRRVKKTEKKLEIIEEERPVAIQIYGGNIESMVKAAQIAESYNPDFIDINAGCWVKNVVGQGAGAGLLKDPCYLQKMVEAVVKAVSLPVTVKTRLGIDSNSIHILDNAKRIEDAGASALVLHCRTRVQGHNGDADWSWINKVKDVVNFPVGLNGNIFNANDVKRAFEETNADAVMIARGAIGNPWIFREAKEILSKGYVEDKIDNDSKIKICLRHLDLAMKVKGDKRAILEHRKFYSGYLKGMYRATAMRQQLMTTLEYSEIEDMLIKFLSEIKQHDEEKKLHESQLL